MHDDEHSHSYKTLSITLHDKLAPAISRLGFENYIDDKPTFNQVDYPHHRRFIRPSLLGYDTFHCSYAQCYSTNFKYKYLTITLNFGLHVQVFEEIELDIDYIVNPVRVGKRLPHIAKWEHDFCTLETLVEVDKVATKIIGEVSSYGDAFWRNYRTLDDIQNYFESWSRFIRFSPKGAPHVSKYLMMIAFAKQDQQMFETIVKKYRRFMRGESYKFEFQKLEAKIRLALLE